MKKNYQFNYAAGRPQMYDLESRKKKAERMIKTLSHYFGEKNLKKLSLIDIGASSGIIDNVLATKFKKVVGVDIDKDAISYAKKKFKRKNLIFKVGDALKLDFKQNTFDVVICTHIYEHVSDPKKLFKEIYRVLKPDGVCYLAAINKLWPIEPHYDLPFLSYLPKDWANVYVKIFNKAKQYYETPLSFWELQKLCSDFKIVDYTQKIMNDPKKFGYSDKINGWILIPSQILSPISKYLAPTFFWLLIKD